MQQDGPTPSPPQLPAVPIERFLPHMARCTFRQGETLFHQGDPADAMFYIQQGAISLSEIGKVLGPGEVLGEMGLLCPANQRTVSAVCVQDLVAYRMDMQGLLAMVDHAPRDVFALIQLAIGRYAENLQREVRARAQIESELRIAQEIQASSLPDVATQFPHPTPFDLAAAMDPAREVGGDFFDFFLTDDRTLFVAVGDVSGKGVPAALFMMTVKTSLKAEAMGGLAPVEVLRRVNRNIQAGNTAGMFVTILCASVDLVTGHARFGNAGHCPPLARLGTAPFRFVDVPPSPVLGLQPNQTFSAGSLTLHCGDALFLYTDGVTEATDPRGDFYGDERLLAQLQRGPAERMSDLTAAVRNDIRAFAGQAQQSDDVTLLAVRYGGSGTAEVTQAGASPTAARPERGTAGPTTCLAECRMAARRENSPAFLAVAAACAQRCGLTPERIAAVELAVEEVLAVLVRHVSGATGDIALRCGADAARLYFEFVAHGMPLGVLAKPDPTQPASPASRECDGLELPLTMQATAELRCHRQGDCDRLILGVDR